MHLHLITPGTKLRVKDNLFEARFFDSNDCLQRETYSPSVLKSIWLHFHTTISTATLALAQQFNVDIVFTDIHGFPIGRFHPHKPFSTSLIQKRQTELSNNPYRFVFVYKWIIEKIETQISLLSKLKSRRPLAKRQFLDKQIDFLMKLVETLAIHKEKLNTSPNTRIRGIEGAAGRIFFGSPTIFVERVSLAA